MYRIGWIARSLPNPMAGCEASAMITAVSAETTKKPPLYSHAASSPALWKIEKRAKSDSRATAQRMIWAGNAIFLGSAPGRHTVANAAPSNKPMQCVSVPKYRRLASPEPGTFQMNDPSAIRNVDTSDTINAIRPTPGRPRHLYRNTRANGHNR